MSSDKGYWKYLRQHSKFLKKCPKCNGDMYADIVDDAWKSYLVAVCVKCGYVEKSGIVQLRGEF
jgi:predicted nucleic-acid-binding Zn-ribbon protein